MNSTINEFLLVISVLLLIFSSRLLFNKLKKEIQKLLDQFQNLYEKFKSVNRSSELISSSRAPSDILNVITIELAKIIGNCASGVFIFEDKEKINFLAGNESFNKWSKQISSSLKKLKEICPDIKENKIVEIKTPVNLILVQSAIFMPITVKEKVIGALAVLSLNNPRFFSEEEKNYIKLSASQASLVVGNINHIDTEKTYKEELLSLNAITELGLLSLNSEELVEVFVNRFASITKAEYSILFMRISQTSDYTVAGTCGLKFKEEADIMNSNMELLNNVFSSGNTCRMGNKIGLPLKTNYQVFGCIVISKEDIEEKEILHYGNLAEKASIIFERAKINEATSTMINELSAVSYIGNVILSTLRLDDVLNLISKSVCEIMDAKGATLRLLDIRKQELELCVSYGLSSKLAGEEKKRDFTATEKQVIKTHQIIEITDPEKSEYKEFNQLMNEGVKSLVCIPLLAKNKVIGILTLYFRYKKVLSENDKKIMTIFTSHTAIAVENTRLFKSWKEMYINVIKSFATALDEKDNYTKGHSDQVLKYATDIALEMKLQESDVELLQYSSILHDIGKIGVSDQILRKPDKLTKEEYEIIKKHPVIGSNIIGNIEEFKEVANIIKHHHEAYGGNGYPGGLKKEEIPLLSRIIAVVDSFEAMTSNRTYRKAMSHTEALKQLELNKNIQFDPKIVDIFKKVLQPK